MLTRGECWPAPETGESILVTWHVMRDVMKTSSGAESGYF
jgi:hypothetical protein